MASGCKIEASDPKILDLDSNNIGAPFELLTAEPSLFAKG